MKIVKPILILILPAVMLAGCGAEKYAVEKRNLMLISKSEMPANRKYSEPGKRKTNKIKAGKTRRKSLF